MKKIYKEAFNNIHLSKDIDNKVFAKTIYKKNNFMLKNVIVTISILLFISITSLGIVYAKEIVEKIKSLFVSTTIHLENSGYNIYLDELKITNKKNLNFDAKFSNINFPVTDSEQKVTFKELKEDLNIDILTPNIFENKIARIIKLEKNNNKISHGWFAFDNIYVFKKGRKKGKISMIIEFITKYHEDDYLMVNMGQTRDESRIYKTVELNEKLDTEIFFWGTRAITNDDENIGTLKATFIYDDIVYTFIGSDVSKNEMLNLINTLAYNNN